MVNNYTDKAKSINPKNIKLPKREEFVYYEICRNQKEEKFK